MQKQREVRICPICHKIMGGKKRVICNKCKMIEHRWKGKRNKDKLIMQNPNSVQISSSQ
jgi:hypothetical protein